MHATEVGLHDLAGAEQVDGGVEVVTGDVELAGEVVARPERQDAEHATLVGGDAREGVHRPVAAARDDRAAVAEGAAGEGEEIVGVGGEHQLDVEVGGGERVEHPRESGPGPTPTRRQG